MSSSAARLSFRQGVSSRTDADGRVTIDRYTDRPFVGSADASVREEREGSSVGERLLQQ